MKLRYSARTHVGQKRETNEDSFGPPELPMRSPTGQLMVVCDGMGGHAYGEVASKLGVKTVLEVYYEAAGPDREAVLKAAFEEANRRIYDQGHGNMGTTGVAALLYRDQLLIANVGDSRAYLVRDGRIEQLSHDHSLVAEQVQAGLLTQEQARTSHIKNLITRALGHQPEVRVDVFHKPVEEGDVVVLSSDGLHGLVEDEEIRKAVMHLPPEKATDALIRLSNSRGGTDNITVIVAQVEKLDRNAMIGTTTELPAARAPEPAASEAGAEGAAMLAAVAPTTASPQAHAPNEAVSAAPEPPPVPEPSPPPVEAPVKPPTMAVPMLRPAAPPPARPTAPPPVEPTTSSPRAAAVKRPTAPPTTRRAAPVERPLSRRGLLLTLLTLVVLAGIGAYALFNPGLASAPTDTPAAAPTSAVPTSAPPTPVPATALPPTARPTTAAPTATQRAASATVDPGAAATPSSAATTARATAATPANALPPDSASPRAVDTPSPASVRATRAPASATPPPGITVTATLSISVSATIVTATQSASVSTTPEVATEQAAADG
jgi:protein phosphatase